MTTEGAPELTEHLDAGALKCYACGHRCLIKSGKRGICKVRFNEEYDLRFVLWRQFCAQYQIPVDTLPSQLENEQKELWEEMKARRLK